MLNGACGLLLGDDHAVGLWQEVVGGQPHVELQVLVDVAALELLIPVVTLDADRHEVVYVDIGERLVGRIVGLGGQVADEDQASLAGHVCVVAESRLQIARGLRRL